MNVMQVRFSELPVGAIFTTDYPVYGEDPSYRKSSPCEAVPGYEKKHSLVFDLELATEFPDNAWVVVWEGVIDNEFTLIAANQ